VFTRRNLLIETGTAVAGTSLLMSATTSAAAADWTQPYPKRSAPAEKPRKANHKIVTDFPRLSTERLAFLKEHSRGIGSPFGYMADYLADTQIKPIREDMRIFGQALTVDLPEPDLLIPSYAMKLAKPGDVLVINAYGRSDVACLGYSMSQSALNRGMAGIIIDGATGDTTELRAETPHAAEEEKRRGRICPVYARHTTPAWAGWDKPGSINVPIKFGGLDVSPGDLVIGVREGVYIIPQAKFDELEKINDELLALAAKRGWQPRIRAGEIWYDILEMQPIMDALNIPHVSSLKG
jgi:regulator of RNase E activity RraA